MGSTNCMNEVCRSTVSSEWKKGWSLKSGGFATLCYNCGSAYENSFFCETFHSDESGWRECKMCRKRIHCGCIASRYLHEYMDFGGVGCISCVKRFEMHPVQPMQILSDIPNGTFVTNGRDNGTRDLRPIIENKIQDDRFSTERLLQLTKAIEANDVNSPLQQPKRDDFMLKTGESSKRFPNFTQPYTPSPFLKEKGRPKQGVKDMYESPAQPSLNYSRMNNSSNPVLPFPVGIAEKGEQNKGSSQQGQRTRHILPKPVKPIPVEGSENNNNNNSNNNNNNNNTTNTNNNNNNNYNKASVSQPRVTRPPAEGRGRNQLLPRYWPRITDQELQQLSGDLKSTIVPLFEKILSASDAGRIGRLVLPKACAEAYFPAINQSEGIPIRIQDIKGKEWTFQFRFWPNNNSRMYVLEGVTPCIQTMQLQAGDTVTFSRIDPGGQLVIGCQKATNADAQDSQASYIPNGDSAAETSFSGAIENVPNGGKTSDHMSMSEKKKAGNMKNKSLLMHSEDAMELRVTWEEAQELLCPSPDSEPAVVIVEELEFEEFQEPPVFGKRTIFTSRPSGEQEQLAQCDTCSKWRRLPVNALLSAKWTCSDNIWDSNRSSCSAREDINTRDLEFYLGTNKDFKQRRISEHKLSTEGEPFGLDVNEQTVTDTHFEQDEPLPIDVIKGKARVQDEEPKQEPYHPSIFLADTPEPEFEKFLEKYQRWMLLRNMDIEDIQEYVENKGWEPRVELEKLVRIFGHGKPYKVLMNSRYLDHLMQTAIADWQKVVAEIFGQTGEVPRETAPSKEITIRELSPTVQPEQLPQQSPTHRAETALVESTTDKHKEPSQDEEVANAFVETTVQQKERVVQEAENAKVDATSAQLEEMTDIANVEKDSQNEKLVETAIVEKDIQQEERAETVLADKDSQQKEYLLNLEAKTALEDSTLDLSKEIEIGKHAANALVEATTDQPKEDAEKQLGQETQLAITVVAPKDADLLQQSQATKATVENADVRQFSESDWVDTIFSDDQATENPSTVAEQSQQVLIVKSVNELINIDTYIPDAQAVEDTAHELDNLPLGKSLKRKTHIDSSGTEDSQHEQRRRRLVELTARSKFIASQTFPFQVMWKLRKSNKKLKEVNDGLE